MQNLYITMLKVYTIVINVYVPFRYGRRQKEDIKLLNAAQIFEAMRQAHPTAMRGMTAYSLSRVLPQLSERIHTMKGNVYRVMLTNT